MIRNPPIDRLRYIAKTYAKQPWIIIDMIDVIARTVGADHWRHDIRQAARVDPKLQEDLAATGALLGTQGIEHQAVIMGKRLMPRDYEAVAQAFVAMAGELHGFKTAHQADGAFPWMATQLSKITKQGRRKGDVREMAAQYRLVLDDFMSRGTAIGQWMHATRPDLTKMDYVDVMAAVDTWVDDQDEESTVKGSAVYNWDDGWTIQKLTTEEQLDAEGERMQHCVGSYCDVVREGHSEIYSLRDPRGHSHVTVEYDPKKKRIVQTKGKQNAKPKPEYQERIDEWIAEGGIDTSGKIPERLRPILEAIDRNGGDYEDDGDDGRDLAENWENAAGGVDQAVEWIGVGMSPYDYRIVEMLHGEDVTPQEYQAFPVIINRKLEEGGANYREMDEWVTLARMTLGLEELSKSLPRVAAARDAQLALPFDASGGRHEALTTDEMRDKAVNDALLAAGFSKWDVRDAIDHRDEIDYRIPEAVEWIKAEFHKPDEMEEWWKLGFAPGEAREWSDWSVEPEIARRLTDAGIDYHEYQDVLRRHRQLDPRTKGDRPHREPTEEELEAIIEQALRDREEDERLRRNRRRR